MSVLAVSASQLLAGSGINATFVVLSSQGSNGTSNGTFYGENFGLNTPFNGLNLGTFDTSTSDYLTLKGGEVNTFKDTNVGDDIFGTTGFYIILPSGSSTPASNSFSSFNIGFNSNTGGGGGFVDQKWQETGLNVNLLSGLNAGNYDFYAYNTVTANFGTMTDSGPTSGYYKATFTVVPEPSSIALLMSSMAFGTMFLMRRRTA